MATAKWTAVSVLAFVVLFVCAAPNNGSDRTGRSDTRYSEYALPLTENEVPYQGYGEVDILNDGTVVIQINGALYVNPVTDDMKVEPEDALAYKIDPTDLRLVESDGFYFLDRGGEQIAERGLREHEVKTTAIDGVIKAKKAGTRVALVSLYGDLDLDFDARTGVLSVSIIDTRRGYEAFALEAPIKKYMPQTKDGRARISPDRESEPSIVLEDDYGVHCSATCSSGNCSITCDQSKLAICYCKSDGTPVCKCVNMG
jgi:hypothetical protein